MRLAYTKSLNIYDIAYNTCFQPLLAKLSDDNNDSVKRIAKERLKNIK